MHHVTDVRSHLESQEVRYAALLRHIQEHPTERARWDPQLAQLRWELDDIQRKQSEYGRSAVNMSGHVEELAERVQRHNVHGCFSPGVGGSIDAADLREQVLTLLQGTRAAEQEAMAAKAAVESVRSHFINTVSEFRAEVLTLKGSFESVVDTTKKALAGVSEMSRSRNTAGQLWETSHDVRDDGMEQEALLRSMRAEVEQAMQESFDSRWESHSAALVRRQEEAHEKLTELVAHVIGEQVVSVSGAALAMALRKDVGAVRVESEQLQREVVQMTSQLRQQIEDLEMRAMLQEASRPPQAGGGSLAAEMQCDTLGREVGALREEVASQCGLVREEVEALRGRVANEKRMRGLLRADCDELSQRLDEASVGCSSLRAEFEALTGQIGDGAW